MGSFCMQTSRSLKAFPLTFGRRIKKGPKAKATASSKLLLPAPLFAAKTVRRRSSKRAWVPLNLRKLCMPIDWSFMKASGLGCQFIGRSVAAPHAGLPAGRFFHFRQWKRGSRTWFHSWVRTNYEGEAKDEARPAITVCRSRSWRLRSTLRLNCFSRSSAVPRRLASFCSVWIRAIRST